jgi:hypothetical protein
LAACRIQGDKAVAISLDALSDIETQEWLVRACDFNVGMGYGEPSWSSVDGVDRPEVIARDGSGGEFVVLAPSPRVLYVSSEGAAGVVAADTDELVALVVLCPYWRDLLRCSTLEEMRQAAPRLERSWLDEDQEFGKFRKFLKAKLGLSDRDPIAQLYHAASTSDVTVRASDGTAAVPLIKTPGFKAQ